MQKQETDTECAPRRYDEENDDGAEDDGAKRKKEFSELFRKQMGLRKVKLNHQHTQTRTNAHTGSTEKETQLHAVALCFCTCARQLSAAGRCVAGEAPKVRIVVNGSHMFGGTGAPWKESCSASGPGPGGSLSGLRHP